MSINLLQKFLNLKKRDSKFINKINSSWAYQDDRKRKNDKYEDSNNDFDTYNGPNDLLLWFNWLKNENSRSFIPKEHLDPLVEKMEKIDRKILSDLGLKYEENYYENIGVNSASDYLFQNAYIVPERRVVKNILDFGAGYGRQALMWSQNPEILYCGVDAIPKSYLLQNLYYSKLNCPFYDYMDDPDNFKIDHNKKGIYHLPTWRLDLIESESFDLVSCVQVINELSYSLTVNVIKEFKRILKPGGALYIRDHENHKMVHGKSIDSLLLRSGFVLEYRPHISDSIDCHGVPRIWRKIDPEVIRNNSEMFKLKFVQIMANSFIVQRWLIPIIRGLKIYDYVRFLYRKM